MSYFKLERRLGGAYAYLSDEESELYDKLKDSKEEKDQVICKLIIDKAKASRASHCASSY